MPKATECAVCFAESESPRRRERKEDLGVVFAWSRSEFVVEVRERTGDVVSFLGDVGLLIALGQAPPLRRAGSVFFSSFFVQPSLRGAVC